MPTLAEKLKKARKKTGLKMHQVAALSLKNKDARARITQSYISRLECGQETNPSYLKIICLSNIYKIKPESLF